VWTLDPRTALERAAGTALYLAAVAVFVVIQEVGLALAREERRAWWAGTGRDALNFAGFTAIAAALRGYGFPLAAALLAGGTLTLVLFGTSVWLETRPWRHRRALAIVAGAALAAPLVALPGPLLAALGAAAHRLFPAAP
jgi:hypothetical protein